MINKNVIIDYMIRSGYEGTINKKWKDLSL